MEGDHAISWLMFFTFAAVIAIITGFSIQHLHSRRNRDIAKHALAGENTDKLPATDGALPDLVFVGMFAAIVMALLAMGVWYR